MKHTDILKSVALLASASCCALGAGAASAETVDAPSNSKVDLNNPDPQSGDGSDVGTIIVTAQRRNENLQNVPIAVSAYSSDELKAQGIRGLTDLVNITPSLVFTFAGGAQAPFLRGVGSNSSFPGSEAEVQTYVDGVYYAAQVQGLMKFNNIVGVEVDKGPQGTLFGRNATGGVIQIATRAPSDQTSIDLAAGYGSYDLKELDFYATTGLAAGLAVDLAVHFEDQDGWGRNVATGNDVFWSNNIAVRNKWLWTLSDATKLTLIADYGRDKGNRGAAFTRTDGNAYVPPGETVPVVPLGFYTVNLDRDSSTTNTQKGVSLKVDTQLGSLPFATITSFRDTKSDTLIDSDFSQYNYQNGIVIQKQDTVTQEVQLFSPSASKRIQWILGAYFYYDKAKTDPLALVGSSLPPPVLRIDNYARMTTHSYSGYGQATFNIADTTHLTGGLRFTQDYRRQSGQVLFVFPDPIGTVPLPGGNLYPKATYHAWTGKVSLSQDFTDNTMGYVSYNRGFKSGIFNTYIVLTNPMPPVDPEYIDAYEAGIKSELFDRRLRINSSLFYYKYSNLQVQTYGITGFIVLANAASANIKGAEVEFEAAVTNNTRLQGGVSVVDAEYSSFPSAPGYLPNPITSPNANGGMGGAVLVAANATGNRMPFAPKLSANVSINQDIPLKQGKISLSAALKYQSKIYFTPDNNWSQDGYALLSGSARWTPDNERWDVMLWGRNLTAKKAYGMKSITGFGSGGIPIEPRVIGVRLDYHYR